MTDDCIFWPVVDGGNTPGEPRRVVAYAVGFPEYERHAEAGLEALSDFDLTS